ncbi:MAG: response regulator [Magnetococcales bacterium]|nr:response regulator [Magnetococcales bacterium]
MRRLIGTSADLELVGEARNGVEALALIPEVHPHVVCTDLHMPKMDGLTLTQEIMRRHPLPILVISVAVSQGCENAFKLLEAGAIDIFSKPRAGLDGKGAPQQRVAVELVRKIKLLSGVSPIRRHSSNRHDNLDQRSDSRLKASSQNPPPPLPSKLPLPNTPPKGITRRRSQIVVIGSSTGGPQALRTIFSALPPTFPMPILCIQHISPGFQENMIEWLKEYARMPVQTARQWDRPRDGVIYFPQEGHHLTVDGSGRFEHQRSCLNDHGHCPSVDLAFRSVIDHYSSTIIGVLLSGMGDDGSEALLAIHRAGGTTIIQDEASCVVFGMPGKAVALGAAQQVLPVKTIANKLLKLAANKR